MKYNILTTKKTMETRHGSAVADDHLIGKERVNHILGQFDKFYEMYDIDENSPYYVPEDKRLSVF